jgi:hypothetical protein
MAEPSGGDRLGPPSVSWQQTPDDRARGYLPVRLAAESPDEDEMTSLAGVFNMSL